MNKRAKVSSATQHGIALSRAVRILLLGSSALVGLQAIPASATELSWTSAPLGRTSDPGVVSDTASTISITSSVGPGLTINLTYDPDATFTAAGLSAADIVNMKAANAYAALQFTSRFNDPININIRVTAVAGTGTLGQSTTFLTVVPFATPGTGLRARTVVDATSLDDLTSVGVGGSFPLVDPIGGAHNYLVSRAQGKALAINPNDLLTDGTYTFGGGFSYTYDPNNRAVAGKIDYIGVSMHEISEIMGRIGIMGVDIGVGSPSYMMMDLFHFTGPGVRGLNNGAGRFFSIDNGTTLLKGWNNASVNGGDLSDWASGTNDTFNAFSSSGVLNALTEVDLRNMDVIGYNRIAVPEPSSALLLLGSGLTFLLRRPRASV